MSHAPENSLLTRISRGVALILTAALLVTPALFAKDKKGKQTPAQEKAAPKSLLDNIDMSVFVWPNPPSITRIRYLNYWAGESILPERKPPQQQKKASWMERVAGITTGETSKPEGKTSKWLLVTPTAVAPDSKGRAYIADSKVRAIFIVDPETGKFEMMKNGSPAKFGWLSSIFIDDADYMYVGDSELRRILILDPQRKVEGTITQGLIDPSGIAVDAENRFLYVTDAVQDLVLVYDADPPYKLLRKIGKEGTKHTSTVPGEFAAPVGVAVDKDGNVYVADTWNNRIEVFDADGQFIRAFGKAGDGPGYFARPHGVAIDSDGHVWVADAMQDRVQVFTPEGRLLIWMGGHGLLPGMHQALASIAIDGNNRVYTTDLMPGRMQVFRYYTNAEALADKNKRDEEAKKRRAEQKQPAQAKTADSKPPDAEVKKEQR